MKFTRDALNLRYEYAGLFARVECVFEFGSRVTPESVEVKSLSNAMHTSIGATTSMNHYRLFKNT